MLLGGVVATIVYVSQKQLEFSLGSQHVVELFAQQQNTSNFMNHGTIS